MAIRVIRTEEDPVLRKISKPVKEVTPKIITLIDDMLETMYEAMGVGLAAPQTGDEGCLSVPGMAGQVTRPNYVKVKAMDEDMNEVIYEGTELLARAFCHEIDHLDGKMYTDLVEGELHRTSYEED